MNSLKSFECYLEKLFESFTYEDFAPENQNEIYGRLKEIFYKSTPFWNKIEDEDKEIFKIEFKRYGKNRKVITLIFSFPSRNLNLSLCEDDVEIENKSIPLANIWLDHSELFCPLKGLMRNGLNKAQETN